MIEDDYSIAEKKFTAYVSLFDLEDERIRLKYEHSLEVASLCKRIAATLKLNSQDVVVSYLCGLLHDIGRFEQLKRWGTFKDAVSCSHAKLGLEVLESKGAGSIDSFVDDLSSACIVKKAVLLHSDLCLPDNLDSRTQLFCNIVRDADKIDIMRVFSECDSETVYGISTSEAVNGRISDAAMSGFHEARCLAPADKNELLDGLVGVACFAFELTLPVSIKVLVDSGNLSAFLDHPLTLSCDFFKDGTRNKWNEVRKTMEDWLNRNS
ncbi:MAG: HD domain-containing protein [Eggerthellaceae bacterium]